MSELAELNINLNNWQTFRGRVFDYINKNFKTPVEREGVFRELAQRLGVSISTVKQDWLEYRNGSDDPPQANGTAAAVALRLLRKHGIVLWQSTDRKAFASLSVPNPAPSKEHHLEHFQVDSNAFKEWIALFYHEVTGGEIIRDDSLSDVIRVLKAEARRGEVYELFTRVGWSYGRVYLDLASPDWKVVEVDEHGFKVLESESSPVRFRRNPYQRPLPEPKPSRDGLFRLLKLWGVKDRREQAKVLSWLVGVFLHKGPYPILIIEGEKGAGKSTLARYLKRLVDPTAAPLLFEPRNDEDLAVATLSNYILVFDNLSRLAPKFSDSLSRLSTGAGIAKRQLYTDADTVVIEATRPVIVTGIAFGELRDDLMDRAIRLELRRISDEERLTDDELEEEFERLLPEALGHLLLAVSQALRSYEEARENMKKEKDVPRMGSWTAWAEAAAPVLGLKPGEAKGAYKGTQTAFNTEVLDADPVAQAVLKLYEGLEEGEAREYLAGELLKKLEEVYLPEDRSKWPRDWPRSAVSLGKRLPRIAGSLREAGVRIELGLNAKKNNKVWVISKPKNAGAGPEEPLEPKGGAPDAGVSRAAGQERYQAPEITVGLEEDTDTLDTEEDHEEDTEEALEEDAGAPVVLQLFSEPPTSTSKKGKEDTEKQLQKALKEEEEEWQKLYGGKSLYPVLIPFDPGKPIDPLQDADPAALERGDWVVIRFTQDLGKEGDQ